VASLLLHGGQPLNTKTIHVAASMSAHDILSASRAPAQPRQLARACRELGQWRLLTGDGYFARQWLNVSAALLVPLDPGADPVREAAQLLRVRCMIASSWEVEASNLSERRPALLRSALHAYRHALDAAESPADAAAPPRASCASCCGGEESASHRCTVCQIGSMCRACAQHCHSDHSSAVVALPAGASASANTTCKCSESVRCLSFASKATLQLGYVLSLMSVCGWLVGCWLASP
jgi:hypothetical protein